MSHQILQLGSQQYSQLKSLVTLGLPFSDAAHLIYLKYLTIYDINISRPLSDVIKIEGDVTVADKTPISFLLLLLLLLSSSL